MVPAQLIQQKNDIIAWLTGLNDTNLINNLHALSQNESLFLNPAQIEMLNMSDFDISTGRLISEEELSTEDRKWLY